MGNQDLHGARPRLPRRTAPTRALPLAFLALVLAACSGPRIARDDSGGRDPLPTRQSQVPATGDGKHSKPVDRGADGRSDPTAQANAEREARIRRILSDGAQPPGETLAGESLHHGGASSPPIPDDGEGDFGPLPHFERFELVTAEASIRNATGDRPGNSWGGHQTRVLRMKNGDVYTAYLVTGASFDDSQWQLVRRDAAGWKRVASGPAGREPVNILRTPNEGVEVVAWPKGTPLLTSLDPTKGAIARRETKIPGRWETSHWPYNAAGIGHDGTLCALQSIQNLSPGAFHWACRSSPDGAWNFQRTSLVYRHSYTYVLPEGKRLTLVATRNVLWSTLGAARTPGAVEYAYNQVHAYSTADRGAAALAMTLVREEVPTPRYPEAVANGQVDAYLDTEGRLHVIYAVAGQSTAGMRQTRHALLANGRVIADVALPEVGYWRITQDSTGRFWALFGTGTRFAVYPALSVDGLQLGRPTVLDLGAEKVGYSGMAIAVPRAGVPLADVVDGGFPSGPFGERWVYFRLRLR
jgi:hypothetical protein